MQRTNSTVLSLLGSNQAQVPDNFMMKHKARSTSSHLLCHLQFHDCFVNSRSNEESSDVNTLFVKGGMGPNRCRNRSSFDGTSRYLSNMLSSDFESTQFRLTLRMMPVRSQFRYCKGIKPNIMYVAHSTFVWSLEYDWKFFLECEHAPQKNGLRKEQTCALIVLYITEKASSYITEVANCWLNGRRFGQVAYCLRSCVTIQM